MRTCIAPHRPCRQLHHASADNQPRPAHNCAMLPERYKNRHDGRARVPLHPFSNTRSSSARITEGTVGSRAFLLPPTQPRSERSASAAGVSMPTISCEIGLPALPGQARPPNQSHTRRSSSSNGGDYCHRRSRHMRRSPSVTIVGVSA